MSDGFYPPSDGTGEEPWQGIRYRTPDAETIAYRDYNPDNKRSGFKWVIEGRETDVIAMLEVKGLGALVMRATNSDPDTGRLDFKGLSLFTDSEIGHRK